MCHSFASFLVFVQLGRSFACQKLPGDLPWRMCWAGSACLRHPTFDTTESNSVVLSATEADPQEHRRQHSKWAVWRRFESLTICCWWQLSIWLGKIWKTRWWTTDFVPTGPLCALKNWEICNPLETIAQEKRMALSCHNFFVSFRKNCQSFCRLSSSKSKFLAAF